MRQWFLAVAVLLGGAVGVASADYVILIANVGQNNEQRPPSTGPGRPGMPGPGGSSGPGGTGGPGGAPGMPPGPGGTGGPGGQQNPNERGNPGFGIGGRPFGPGQMGSPSGPAGQMGSMMGPPGSFGGFLGEAGGTAGAAEGKPIYVYAVVEVKAPYRTMEARKNVVWYDPQRRISPFPLETKDDWGTALLLNVGGMQPDVKFIPLQFETVPKRYEQEYNKVFRKANPDQKPSAEQILKLADFALTHDLNDKFADLMKKLAADYKDDPAAKDVVAAFTQVQAALDKPVTKDGAVELRSHLGDGYKEEQSKNGSNDKGHYVLFYSANTSDMAEVRQRLERLEDSMRTFYYWFARQGRALPVPDATLPALLTSRDQEFHRTHESFSSPPVVADGFFARRENLAVFCASPQDPMYELLLMATDSLWKDYNRFDILSGKEKKGYPQRALPEDRAYVGELALLLKALEDDAERAGTSHDATRQLLFASGLLPRGVTVPEWVQFGMGSFFETPPHAPYPTPTGVSPVYFLTFKEELGDKGKKFEGDAYKTMRKIVTDGYFRELKPADGKKISSDLTKARAATWSLMYFLAQRKRENLERYFQLLGEMPRDLELDEQALWECYARAFDAYDPRTKQIDEAKLGNLAANWQDFVQGEELESQALIQEVQKSLEELKQEEAKAQRPSNPMGPGGPQNP